MRITQYACPLHSSRRLLQIEQENENNFKHIYETKLTPVAITFFYHQYFLIRQLLTSVFAPSVFCIRG